MIQVHVVSLMRAALPLAVAVLGVAASLAQAQSLRQDLVRGRTDSLLQFLGPSGVGRHEVASSTVGPRPGKAARSVGGLEGRAARDGDRTPEEAKAASGRTEVSQTGAAATGMVAGAAAATALGGGIGASAAAGMGVALAMLAAALGWLAWRRRRPAGTPGERRAGAARARSSFAASGYETMALAPESSVHYGPGGIEEFAARTGEFRWGVPQGFDAAGFVSEAKRNFVVLQEAWDAADLERLRALMTDELLDNIQAQLRERGDRPNRTDVVTLHAELLGVEVLAGRYLANVEFSGMIREEVSAGASPFREIWSLTKPADGSTGWLLASVQALQ